MGDGATVALQHFSAPVRARGPKPIIFADSFFPLAEGGGREDTAMLGIIIAIIVAIIGGDAPIGG
jgi:hypothetical protein